MSTPIAVAIVGLGKIARDEHLPAIAANPDLRLAATVSPHDRGIDGVPHHASLAALLADGPAVDAVAVCTPPQVRYDLAATALAAGLHVFLEKPPGATLSEVAALERQAADAGVTLFASWHARHVAGVEPARAWLEGKAIREVRVTWREDVRQWHPGQAWIWEAGGLGVFDPGINALSIVTRILPQPLFLVDALLELPANRAAPIAADLTLRDAAGLRVTADLDWRQTGPQTWDIVVDTDAGPLTLSQGGAVLDAPGDVRARGDGLGYPGLYEHFCGLVRMGASDIDIAPFRLVADAFLRGRRRTVDAFHD